MTSARALACAMAVAMRCRCVAERQPQTKSCTAVETIDLTCGLHVETMMVSKSWSVGFSRPNHRLCNIEQTRPLAVALASVPALRSGTGSALRSTQPVVIGPPGARINLIPRGGPGDSFRPSSAGAPAVARARATSRGAAYHYQCRAPRDTRTRDATRGHAPKRVLYAVPPARVARLALGFATGAGRGGRVDALVHGRVRTPIRGSGTHSFLDSSHVRSVTASYCHSPTTAGRLSR